MYHFQLFDSSFIPEEKNKLVYTISDIKVAKTYVVGLKKVHSEECFSSSNPNIFFLVCSHLINIFLFLKYWQHGKLSYNCFHQIQIYPFLYHYIDGDNIINFHYLLLGPEGMQYGIPLFNFHLNVSYSYIQSFRIDINVQKCIVKIKSCWTCKQHLILPMVERVYGPKKLKLPMFSTQFM